MTKHLLLPDWEIENVITSINQEEISLRGLRSLLIDVDGTLLPKYSTQLHKDVNSWIQKSKQTYKIYLISNNLSYSRIRSVASQLDLPFIHRALKPRTFSLKKAIKEMRSNINEVAIIGDRIFTDVLAGNRLGIYTILVKSIAANNIYNKVNKTILLERFLSRTLGAYYK